MAERLADILAQMQNVRQLGAVVTAMRGIAASRAQKARSLLAGIDAYAETVSRAIERALTLLPPDFRATPMPRPAKPGLILFCAEQGFAGAFSERVLETAAAEFDDTVILVIGTRGAIIASERGLKPAWSAPMTTYADAVVSLANGLTETLYGFVASGRMATVDIVYPRTATGGGIHVDRHSLLPIDFRRFAQGAAGSGPVTMLDPEVLLERLAAEYVYAQLCQAAIHAFAAENEARMMAMASAKTNIETKLASLQQRERQVRQEEITTEIIELAAGAEASQGAQPKDSRPGFHVESSS
jgi:F-type H+-transporting ATPase subunit gamma